jgi:hypothetical protein
MSIHISNVAFNNLSELLRANCSGITSGFDSSTKRSPWYGNSPGIANSDGVNAVRYELCDDGEDDYGYDVPLDY